MKTGKDGKIGDRGVTGMFMGYGSNHEGDCYRIRNPNTKKVPKTRDVVFLNRMFFRTPMMPVHNKQGTDVEDLDSVQQDKRGSTITADFVTGDNNAATVKSVDSSCWTLLWSTTAKDSPSMDAVRGGQFTMTLQQVVRLVQKLHQ
jgi:hypothetical protein